MAAGASNTRCVIARHFPAAWVAPAALGNLPNKVQLLLQRIGELEGPPTICQGASGLEAIARFQKAEAARDAVETLHGTDMRSPAEKQAANFQAPKESERFFLQLSPETSIALGTAAARSAPGALGTPLAAPENSAKRRFKPNGVCLSPLPTSWAENDVMLLASPYGTVQRMRIEALPGGQKGAFIDYQKESAAQGALQGLNGLTLMGAQLRCVMQEELDPAKPLLRCVIFIDELPAPSRPDVEPCLDDRELFITELPRTSRTQETAHAWISAFGAVEEVTLIMDSTAKPVGKAYARFQTYAEGLKAMRAIRATATDGTQQVAWSESERVLRGTCGSYGIDVLRRLSGENCKYLQDISQATGAASITIGGTDDSGRGDERASSTSNMSHVHFIVRCDKQSQADECRSILSAGLQKVHMAYSSQVHGSLVLRGFPASWSEKGLKFVFAPFGGLLSVVLEQEQRSKATSESPGERVAYVKLKNEGATEKAVTNLHQTKVGDGDLVEECVVVCRRWHPRTWSDGSFHMSVFIDQLIMNRRPADVGPGPEDCELFVRNLPLQDMKRQQLQEYFEGFGEVEDLHLIKDTFTNEPNGEGYVRFRQHRDAKRCIEALTPENEAEPTDLAGCWSESERALQRKANCYKFNLVAELVGADGSGLERLKTEAKLKGLWVLAESLQQRDRTAPPPSGRQLHFVGRCFEESHVQLFRELLERALEETHAKIMDRMEKRKRKAVPIPAEDNAGRVESDTAAPTEAGLGASAGPCVAKQPPPVQQAASEVGSAFGAPSLTTTTRGDAWHAGGAWPPPAYWGNWRPTVAGGNGPPAPGGTLPPPGLPPFDVYRFPPGQGVPTGYGMGPPPTGPAPWGRSLPPGPPAQATVFEQRQPATRATDDMSQQSQEKERCTSEDKKQRSRSRHRKHRSSNKEKERKHRSNSRKRRRRRRDETASPVNGDASPGDK